MIRWFRLIVVFLFLITALAFSYTIYKENKDKDNSIPVINVDDSVLKVKFNASNKDFLKGVTASDAKDGDLTDKVIVESVSRFTDSKKGICKVTYGVCDSDNHVSTASRKVQYVGYKPPTFFLNGSLCISLYEKVSVSNIIGAKDLIDGDISSNVIITSSDYESGIAGNFILNVKVTSSKGANNEISLPLVVEDRSVSAPSIELTDYLIYVKKGTDIDFSKYLVSAKDAMETDLTGAVWIEPEYNSKHEGVYSINYYVKDSLDRLGHAVLLVVVG